MVATATVFGYEIVVRYDVIDYVFFVACVICLRWCGWISAEIILFERLRLKVVLMLGGP